MKTDILKILACPSCKEDLQIDVKEEKGEEIVSGSLFCRKCDVSYPIMDTIPNLLPPDNQA